jgi:hypothetical protein
MQAKRLALLLENRTKRDASPTFWRFRKLLEFSIMSMREESLRRQVRDQDVSWCVAGAIADAIKKAGRQAQCDTSREREQAPQTDHGSRA